MVPKVPEEVLERQIDAVARLLSLFPDMKMTINDAIDTLARAEYDAQFVCGFIDLNQYDDEKDLILKQLVARDLGTIDRDGHIALTPGGQKRAAIRLPEPIEQMLERYKS